MRKRILEQAQNDAPALDGDWMNLENLAEIEMTSEDPTHPIEAALVPGHTGGWRAAGPGKQTIRLLFNQPQRLRCIQLSFSEQEFARTQEYVVRWSAGGGSFREIVRQQWNFSPNGATTETEEHHLDLPGTMVLELNIVPDISGGKAVASLAQLRLA